MNLATSKFRLPSSAVALLLAFLVLDANAIAAPAPPPSAPAGILAASLTAQTPPKPSHSQTAAAIAERAQSAIAYRNQPDADALSTLRAKVPEVVLAPSLHTLRDLPTGTSVLSYGDADHTATVKLPDGQRLVLSSTTALRTENATTGLLGPLDLTLATNPEGFRPVNSPTPVEFPNSLTNPLNVGRFDVSIPGASATGTPVGDSVVWPNALTDTDVVARALPDGAELSVTLRSPASPQDIPLQIGQPAETSLRLAATTGQANPGLEMVDARGAVIGRVSSPVAWDADHVPVPSSWSMDQGTPVLHVDAGGDVTWPIAIDPVINDERYGTVLAAHPWAYQPAPPTPVAQRDPAIADYGWGAGLYQIMQQPYAYSQSMASWWYLSLASRPTASIRQVTAQNMNHDTGANSLGEPETCTFVDLAVGGTQTNVGNIWCDTYRNRATNAGNWTVPNYFGNQARVGMYTNGAGTRGYFQQSVGTLVVALEDNTAPTGTTISQGSQTWNATTSLHPSATDSGVGVRRIDVSGDGVSGSTVAVYGTCATNGLCDPSGVPGNASVTGLPDGITTVRARAYDVAGNPNNADATTQVKFDRSAPIIGTFSGRLYDDRATAFADTRAIRVPLSGEGSTATPAQRRSGVKRIRLLVDGGIVADQKDFEQQDSWVPDNVHDDNVLRIDASSLTAGTHTVVVEASDWTSNPPRTSAPFTITTAAGGTTTVGASDTSLVGDADGNGTDDLVTVSTAGVVKVFPSDGTAGFGAGTTWKTWSGTTGVALADVDGDGDSDLVGRTSPSADVRVALSNGTSFGTPNIWRAAAPAGTIMTADVDGSGTDDLVIVQSTGVVQAAYAEGGVFDSIGTFTTLPAGSQPQLGDVTGDGIADLVLIRAGRVEVRVSNANAFGAVQDWGAAPPGEIVIDDADGDDTADLLTRLSTGAVVYLRSSGSAFVGGAQTTVLPAAYAFATGDVDGDQRADAVGRSGTQVSVHVGTAPYPVSDTTWAPTASTPEDPDSGAGFSALAVTGSAGLSLAWADDDLTSKTLESQDDNEPDPAVRCGMPQLTGANDPPYPELAFNRMRQGGASYVRINVLWSRYLEASDKDAYRRGLRNAVFCAQRAGLTPYMTITSAFYDSPTPHILNPSPTQFASLVSAVVTEFYPLGVRRFSMWNEPNLAAFLQAGLCGKTQKDTSALYRSLYSQGYTAARTASNQGAIVYLGELSEIAQTVKSSTCASTTRTSKSTLDFLKDVVNTTPRLVAHGVAWHAYQHRSGPRTNTKGTGIYDITRFQGVLSDLYQNGQLRTPSNKKPGLYVTEFGYWNVPFASRAAKGGRSPVAWSESQRATWLASALNRAAQNGARMFTFWQLNEAYPSREAVTADAANSGPGTNGLDFDTGMLSFNRLLEPNGQRAYGVGPDTDPAWDNAHQRAAFCRVRQWATENGKSPMALASGC